MKTLQGIKSRIRGVKSTKQITNSMELVSSSKVQSAKEYANLTKSFINGYEEVMESILSSNDLTSHPYILKSEKSKVGIIALSSDRGLCGGYNINVAKKAIEVAKKFEEVSLVTMGNRINDSFKRSNISIDKSYLGVSERPLFDEANVIAKRVCKMYREEKVAEIYIVYTKFVTMIEQYPLSRRLLPLDVENSNLTKEEYFLEPDIDKLLDIVVPEYISAVIFGAMVDSALSEQGARVVSMDAASKNSDEIIEKLTLEYNQLRQGAITQELTEIVNGARAIT